MEKHNISQALSLSTVGFLHNYHDGNAETLRVCEQHPNIMPVATIDPRGYFGPAGTVKSILDRGFKALRFFPEIQNWSTDHSTFQDIVDELDGVTIPVIIQANISGLLSSLVKVFKGKNVKLILDGVMFETISEAVSIMKKNDNVLLGTSNIRVPNALRFLVDQVGSHRLVYGSGTLSSSIYAAINYIQDSDISDEDKSKIFSENLKGLLGG
ncbi:MAG: hypothetical protein SNJ70_03580, partial [Armatimonadota bacterium]